MFIAREPSMNNFTTERVLLGETLAVFQDSKWTIYGWWLLMSVTGGALGGIAFSPWLTHPWWRLPIYLAVVVVIRRALWKLAKRVFPENVAVEVTTMFFATFILACLAPGISLLTSRNIIVVPVIVIGSFITGLLHTAFRLVFVRDALAWFYAAASCATIATLIDWLILRTQTHPNLTLAAVLGASIGVIYMVLTTLLLERMWDPGAAQSAFATATLDKEGEVEVALELHDHAIAAKPKDPKLYAARADTYIKLGDVERARADITQALSLDEKCAEARLLRADLLAEEGDLDGAIAEYDQLVNHKWGYQPAYLGRARAYSAKGDYERALADYEDSRKIADDAALTFAYRAQTYFQMGDYDRAIADCERTLGMETMTPIAWIMALVTRGKSYAVKGEDQLAANDFLAVLESPSHPTLLKEAEDGLQALESKVQQISAADSAP